MKSSLCENLVTVKQLYELEVTDSDKGYSSSTDSSIDDVDSVDQDDGMAYKESAFKNRDSPVKHQFKDKSVQSDQSIENVHEFKVEETTKTIVFQIHHVHEHHHHHKFMAVNRKSNTKKRKMKQKMNTNDKPNQSKKRKRRCNVKSKL